MKRLLLIPHGQTDWNAEGRVQGHTDIPMNAHGREQARRLAHSLRPEKIAAIIASDLRRASETADFVSAQVHVPIRIDARLREIHFGDWEGLTAKEIAVHDPAGWERWEKGSLTSPPRGESLQSLAHRLETALREAIATDSPDGAILLVAHRGSLRVLICLALGFDPDLMHRFRLDQASVSELLLSAKGAVLNRLNDIHHLREPDHAR